MPSQKSGIGKGRRGRNPPYEERAEVEPNNLWEWLCAGRPHGPRRADPAAENLDLEELGEMVGS